MGYLSGYRGYTPQGNRVPAEQHSDHLTVLAAQAAAEEAAKALAQNTPEADEAGRPEAPVQAIAAGELGVGQEVFVETVVAEPAVY